MREKHFKKILEFFKDKSKQLLVINIEKKNWINITLDFLQIDIKLDKVIHSNKTSNNNIDNYMIKFINNNVTNCLKNRGYDEDEIIFKDVDLTQYNYKMFL